MLTLLGLIPRWVWAALVAALAATSCKLTIDLGSVKLELEKAKVAEATLQTQIAQANAAAAAQTAALTRKVLNAQKSAHIRAQALSADAASAKSALDELRQSLQNPYALYSKAGLSADSIAVPESPLPELFLQCAGKYQDLAAVADRHASDVKTLTDAWPTNTPADAAK